MIEKDNKIMKKIKNLLFIISFVFLMLLSGCVRPVTPTEIQKNFRILNSVMNYDDHELFSGYIQATTLAENDEIVESVTKELKLKKENNDVIYQSYLKHVYLNGLAEDERSVIIEKTEYYSKTQRYYLEDEVWKIEEKEFQPDGIVKINFKETDFLSDLTFIKTNSLGTLITFTGTIKQENLNQFFKQNIVDEISNARIEAKYDASERQLFSLKITYQTKTNRVVTINTNFLYSNHDFTLPTI